MNIIIPATGLGTRFKEAGYEELKPFIKVNERECILDFVIKCFDIKKDKFYFISRNDEKDKFIDFADTRQLNADVIVYQGEKLGPAGTLIGVKDSFASIINEAAIVSYCDFGQEWDYEDFLDFVKHNKDAQGIIPCYTGYHPHLEPVENVYAVCKTYERSNEVYRVAEKYYSQDKMNEFHSSGIYYFKTLKIAFEAIEKQMQVHDMLHGEYYLSITNNYLDKVLCYPFVKKFYQFGTPKDFEYAKNKLQARDNLVNEGANVDNTVILSAGRGERFLSLSFSQPKPFLPLGNSTIIENIIKTLKNIQTNIICVGAKDHEKYWKNIKVNTRYVEPNKIGAAYSYISACKDLEGSTLILPCDLIAKHIDIDFNRMQEKADAIIFVSKASKFNYDNPHYFTWIEGKGGTVTGVYVKQRLNDSHLIMIGSFYFRDNQTLITHIREMFEKEVKVNGEFYIDSVFDLMLSRYKIYYIVLENYFSYGTPSEYLENSYWWRS